MAQAWRNARLLTLAEAAGPEASTRLQPIAAGVLITEGDTLSWVGTEADLPDTFQPLLAGAQDLDGAVVTPGLIDCHTHLVYAGQRAQEFEQRLHGASYAEIAQAGGGIRHTVAATRASGEEALHALAMARARALMAEGVTTLEVKSGYGLTLGAEAACLRVARRLAGPGLTVRTSFLGAHAVPPEFSGNAEGYIDAVCAWMTPLAKAGLIDAVDAFCETIGFTTAQIRRVFDKARALGLPVKLHAEQLSDQGGAELASAFQALSCDHLEYLSPAGVAALAASGTVAVLLPAAFYHLRETQSPPVAALRAAGVPMAVATDHNPGTAPTLSPLLMLNMACTLFGLTPDEALRGMTVHAARALGLHDRGALKAGLRADFCVWDIDHPVELAAWFGRNPLRMSVCGGVVRDV